ncbi:MAG: aspartyl protease family protein [Paludibacter sp.]|nr:aspartyl protease family protein [Paludibacter sp.]
MQIPRIFITFIFLNLIPVVWAGSRPVATLPFDIVGSYVVVTIRINNSGPLRFILDSGVSHTIITELMQGDSIALQYTTERNIRGLGGALDLKAYLSPVNTLHINKKLKLENKTVFVLENDIFNLSRQTGTKINGLLGADFFQDFIVNIDYNTRKIRFYKPDNFKVPRGYGIMPMYIENQKMYIHLSVMETDERFRTIKMLIDTGAELSAWFQTLTNKAINIPEKSIRGRIGEGLSGEVKGVFARVPQICIANFCVKNPVVVFPDSSTIAEIVRNSDRDGTIGSQLLSRFNLIINTFDKKFYFKPNSKFNTPCRYNIAGLEVAQAVSLLPQIEVVNVWENSPAERAGIKIGDVLNEINYEKVFMMSLQEVRGYFERASRRPLHITVQREGVQIPVQLDMKAKI